MTLTPWTLQQYLQAGKRIWIIHATRALGLALAALAWALSSLDLAVTGACLFALPWMAMYFPFARFFLDEPAPLCGEDCVKMKQYADTHPQVKQFLQEINGQGRPVIGADLIQVEAWVSSAPARAAREMQAAACKEINGLVT